MIEFQIVIFPPAFCLFQNKTVIITFKIVYISMLCCVVDVMVKNAWAKWSHCIIQYSVYSKLNHRKTTNN